MKYIINLAKKKDPINSMKRYTLLLIFALFFITSYAQQCNVYIFKSREDQSITYGAHPSPGNPIRVSAPFNNGNPAGGFLDDFSYVFSRYCKCKVIAYSKKNFKGEKFVAKLRKIKGDEADIPFAAQSFVAKCK